MKNKKRLANKRKAAGAPTISEMYAKVAKVSNEDRVKQALIELIADCMLPISIVEAKSFKHFCDVLGKEAVNLPDRKATTHLIDGYLEAVYNQVIIIL